MEQNFAGYAMNIVLIVILLSILNLMYTREESTPNDIETALEGLEVRVADAVHDLIFIEN